MFHDRKLVAHNQVTAGIAYLSTIDPGWHDRINLNSLDVKHGHFCVLALLGGGSWTEGNKKYQVRDESQQLKLGFYVHPETPEMAERYRELTALWRHEISRLKSQTVGNIRDIRCLQTA